MNDALARLFAALLRRRRPHMTRELVEMVLLVSRQRPIEKLMLLHYVHGCTPQLLTLLTQHPYAVEVFEFIEARASNHVFNVVYAERGFDTLTTRMRISGFMSSRRETIHLFLCDGSETALERQRVLLRWIRHTGRRTEWLPALITAIEEEQP